jgi:hypothetical protein
MFGHRQAIDDEQVYPPSLQVEYTLSITTDLKSSLENALEVPDMGSVWFRNSNLYLSADILPLEFRV